MCASGAALRPCRHRAGYRGGRLVAPGLRSRRSVSPCRTWLATFTRLHPHAAWRGQQGCQARNTVDLPMHANGPGKASEGRPCITVDLQLLLLRCMGSPLALPGSPLRLHLRTCGKEPNPCMHAHTAGV